MDKRGEVTNRWVRVFEQKTPKATQKVLDRIKDNIVTDMEFVMTELKQKETDLANSLNKVDSQFGPLIISEDGILKYRINGQFVDIKTIVDGLREFIKICNMDTMEKRVVDKVDLKTLREVFTDKFLSE